MRRYNEKVIECKSRYSCKITDIKNSECNSNINGKFTTFYEDIKWCNNEEVISLPVDKLKQYMIFVHYKDNLIPGVSIKEDNAKTIIPLNVSNGIILQVIDEDGYVYSSGVLYIVLIRFMEYLKKWKSKPDVISIIKIKERKILLNVMGIIPARF